MRRNTNDSTLAKNYIQKWRHLVAEYELVKAGKHSRYRFVQDFYNAHGTSRQTFLKYYNRFVRQGHKEHDLLPRKRGPKWKTRRPIRFVENLVINERCKGMNRYEIHAVLKEKLKRFTPSPSGIYNITKRYDLNKLKPKMKQTRRKIIKEKAGELGNIDCHYLPKELLLTSSKRFYLVCVIDACTRIVWAEVIPDIKSLTVMFATMRCFHQIQRFYDIQFKEVMTDNGSEFASPKNKEHHPFEKLLLEMGITHRYTRPYRPQTNGKVERFWKTIEEDLIEETTFDSLDAFKEELLQYLFYYNEHRPHQGLDGQIPKAYLQNLSTNY